MAQYVSAICGKNAYLRYETQSTDVKHIGSMYFDISERVSASPHATAAQLFTSSRSRSAQPDKVNFGLEILNLSNTERLLLAQIFANRLKTFIINCLCLRSWWWHQQLDLILAQGAVGVQIVHHYCYCGKSLLWCQYNNSADPFKTPSKENRCFGVHIFMWLFYWWCGTNIQKIKICIFIQIAVNQFQKDCLWCKKYSM